MSKKKNAETKANTSAKMSDLELPADMIFAIKRGPNGELDILYNTKISDLEFFSVLDILDDFVSQYYPEQQPIVKYPLPC